MYPFPNEKALQCSCTRLPCSCTSLVPQHFEQLFNKFDLYFIKQSIVMSHDTEKV